jgi:hypothetical protein
MNTTTGGLTMTTDTMVEATDSPPGDRVEVLFEAGNRIEVWNHFLGSWTGEFEIAAVADGGYRIRRSTDNEILPRAFPADDLRPAP